MYELNAMEAQSISKYRIERKREGITGTTFGQNISASTSLDSDFRLSS